MEFDNIVREKRNALRYFPGLFNEGYHLNSDSIFALKFNLDFDYNKYEEENFGCFYDAYTEKARKKHEEDINKAYHYISGLIKDKEDYVLKTKTTSTLLDQYYKISSEIGKYKFVAHFKNSIGYNQNLNNDNMVMNLTLFEPIIKEALKDVDAFVRENPDCLFTKSIEKRLKDMSDENNLRLFRLTDARHNYHSVWAGACRKDCYTYSELGEAKQEYKKIKNNTGRRVVDFARELVNMDRDIMVYKYATLREDFANRNKVFPLIRHANELIDKYEDVLRRITYGPNCYSYLTGEEIKEHSKENKKSKQLQKKL
jgi:hypothetical protein